MVEVWLNLLPQETEAIKRGNSVVGSSSLGGGDGGGRVVNQMGNKNFNLKWNVHLSQN